MPVKVDDILDKISSVPVSRFDFINGSRDNIGFIAEDFYPVLEHGSNKTVSGQDVQSALWLGTQELIKENKELKTENEQLKLSLDNLEARITALESRPAK